MEAAKKELEAIKTAKAAEECAAPIADAEKLEAARAEVNASRSIDKMLRGLIQGGYEAALAVAEAKRDDIFVRQRGGLLFKAQLDKATATAIAKGVNCLGNSVIQKLDFILHF